MKKVYCLMASAEFPKISINGILLNVFEDYDDAVAERTKLRNHSCDSGMTFNVWTWHVEPKSKGEVSEEDNKGAV